MKNTSIKLIVIFIFFASANILAQQQHYVQVMVSDTVVLKPQQFIYKISDYSYYTSKDTQTTEKVSFSEINDKLVKENFAERVEFNDYSINGFSKTNNEILVTVNSVAELQRLYNLLKDINGISGKISNIQYESPELYTNKLFSKMFRKAKNQAEMLASATGNQLGSVTNVSEVKGQWEGLLDFYMGIEKEIPTEFLKSNPDFGKPYYRNFQFTFELK